MDPKTIYKRVACPECRAPQGGPCRDRTGGTFTAVKPHVGRLDAADLWQRTKSPDGLTPMRREEMIESLKSVGLKRAEIGKLMEKITTCGKPEEEFARIRAARSGD